MQIFKWRCYEGILKYKYFGILYFKNVLSFPSLLKPSGLTVLDMMVPDDMVQISIPFPCTGYTIKSLFCINSKEKLTEFYGMVTVYSGLYQKPLVVQKITILNYEKTHTHCLSQSMNLYYHLILKITSRILRSYIHGIPAQKKLQQLPFYN